MKRRYSADFSPPAPVLAVTVRCPDEPDGITLHGKLDSGADVCGVPDSLVERLDLPPVRMSRAAGFAGDLREVVVYRVDLVLAGVTLERIEALATRRPYVIVGRNALASFTLRLDGPKQELEIRSPSPSRVKRRRSSRR